MNQFFMVMVLYDKNIMTSILTSCSGSMYNDGALTFAYLADLEYWDIIIADLLMLRLNDTVLSESQG